MDHTFIQESLELGVQIPEGAEHVITRFFGGGNFLPHIATGQDCLKAGDVFLVCSDGLSDVVSKNDIRRTLVSDAYLFVMIGLYSGLRKEEILALQWDCVFLDML